MNAPSAMMTMSVQGPPPSILNNVNNSLADKETKVSVLVIDGMLLKDCINRCVIGEELLRVLDRLPVTSHFDGKEKV